MSRRRMVIDIDIPSEVFDSPLARPFQLGLLRERIEARHGLVDLSLLRRIAADQSTIAIRLANETTA